MHWNDYFCKGGIHSIKVQFRGLIPADFNDIWNTLIGGIGIDDISLGWVIHINIIHSTGHFCSYDKEIYTWYHAIMIIHELSQFANLGIGIQILNWDNISIQIQKGKIISNFDNVLNLKF